MASKNSAATVKISGSAANYTPATLDPELRSAINSVLIEEGHVGKYVLCPHVPEEMSPVDPVTVLFLPRKQDPRPSFTLAACPLVQLAHDSPESRPGSPPLRRNQYLPRPSTTSFGRCAPRYSQCSLRRRQRRRCERKEAIQRRRHYQRLQRQRARGDNDSTEPSGSAGRDQ